MSNPASKKHRTHPLTILFNLRQFFILAIIPILRGLFSALKGGLSTWSQGLWMDLFILLLILLFSFLSWWRLTYEVNALWIHVRRGLFTHGRTQLPWSKATVIKVVYPFLLRPFKIGFLRVDTLGGSHRKADISLILLKRNIDSILALYEKNGSQKKGTETRVVAPLKSVLGLALLSTNSFAGIFYMATFISQSGKILGREFSDLLLIRFQAFTQTINIQVPPAAAALAYILIVAWIIGVFFTVLRYLPFSAQRTHETLVLTGGYLSRQQHYIHLPALNFINIRQNVLTFFLGLHSVYISAIGCGKERADITCVVPLGKKPQVTTSVELLFPSLHLAPLTLKPSPWGFMRFLFDPLVTCGSVLLAALLGIYFIPSWTSFIEFVGIMALIPSLAFLVMRLIEYGYSGIGRGQKSLTFRYSTGFTLHTQLIPLDKIVKVQICQSFWQRYSGKCDLLLFTQGERRSKHKCRNLEKHEAIDFFGLEDINTSPTYIFPTAVAFLLSKYEAVCHFFKRQRSN